MSSLIGASLMKRGFETMAQKDGNIDVKFEVSGWAIGIFAVTGILFMYLLFVVEYTFGRVVPTLIMVESPQDSIAFEAIPSEVDDMIKKSPEPVAVTRPQYLTSTFRSSMKLLKAEGGRLGHLRGVGILFANAAAVNWISKSVSALVSHGTINPHFFMPIGAVICAQLSLGWTLVVITETSPKFWFRRIPSFKAWKKIAGPTAVYSLIELVGTLGPLCLLMSTNWLQDPKDIQKLPLDVQQRMVLEAVGIFAVTIVYFIGIVLPAKVTLTRMQASLVNDSEDTIVPFDRTFGGKVVPEIVGGSGMVGALDAWKTFDKAGRLRLIKAYLKCFAMVVGASVWFTGVFIAECYFFAPEVFKTFRN